MEINAAAIIGQAIRQCRAEAGLTQEQLAAKAGITYQYLSDIENGKKNFTLDVGESVAHELGLTFETLVELAYAAQHPLPQVKAHYFIPGAPLPPGLTQKHLTLVLNETHKVIRLINTTLIHAAGRALPAYIQGNNFSGIVSNILTDSFSRLSPYKHNHDQRYPDLMYRGVRTASGVGLELKTTIQQGKGGESHNGHPGWHVIACFAIDAHSGDIKFIHVMFADLEGHSGNHPDWKYVGSAENAETGSRRTETYTTTPAGTAKLRHGTVYLDTSVINISRWRTSCEFSAPSYSPFQPRMNSRRS